MMAKTDPRSLLLLGLAAACLALCLSFPSSASAGAYNVKVCDADAYAEDGISFTPPAPGMEMSHTCGDPGSGVPSIVQKFSDGATGSESWTLTAPSGSRILQVQLGRLAHTGSSSNTFWEVLNSTGVVESTNAAMLPEFSVRTFEPGAPQLGDAAFTVRLRCNGQCGANGGGGVSVRNVLAVMNDFIAPEATLDQQFAKQPLRGTVKLDYALSDGGGGLHAARLIIDGSTVENFRFRNGEKCVKPYKFVQPCITDIVASYDLDTTTLPDGAHVVKLAVEDASGVERFSNEVPFTVQNRPRNIELPSLTGTPRVKSALTVSTGKWESATSFKYEWSRCAANLSEPGQSCEVIPDATQSQYTLTDADVGKRIVATVTAANSVGEEFAATPLSAVVTALDQGDKTAPVLSNVSLSRKRFALGKRPTALIAAAKKRGTVLRLNSSEAGRLSVTISRLRRGKAPKVLATLQRTIGAGANRVALSGRVKRKALSPGRYRLTLSAVDGAGNISSPVRIGFTLLPG